MQRKLDAVQVAEQAVPPLAARQNQNGHAKIAILDPGRSTMRELQKLTGSLFLSPGKSSPRLVAFAGVESGECCSKMTVQVAVALAQSGTARVCLVDAYSHSPSLSEFFGFGSPCGLTDARQLGGSILEYTIPVSDGILSLLPWGGLDTEAVTRLPLDLWMAWFDELRAGFDYVLVNGPPLNQFADGIAMGQLSDGMVPVANRKSTQPVTVLRELERLRDSHVRICGAILD